MHNEDMGNAGQPGNEDLSILKTDVAVLKTDIASIKADYSTKDDLALARRDMALAFDRTITRVTEKMDSYHVETSRSLSTLMQAVMTMQGMFQRVDNDQTFTRRRLDDHDGRLKALERRRKPS